MSGGFNPDDYVPVAERLIAFYDKYPDGSVQSDIIELSEKRVVMRATVYRTATDERPSVAHSALAIPGKTGFTRDSEIENAETSAVGRAIAMMGFEVKRGVASREEVRGKRDDHNGHEDGAAANRTTHVDGLIGKAITSGTQDFELRQHPEKGFTLPFRIKEGRLNQIVLAQGELAMQLYDLREQVIDARITVWGHYEPQTFPDKKRPGEDITYNVLFAERVKVGDRTLPEPTDAIPVAPGQVAAWDQAESDAIDREAAEVA